MINAGSIRSGGNNLGKSSALTPGNPIAAKAARALFTDGWKNEFASIGAGTAVDEENIMGGGGGEGGALCASMLSMRPIFACCSRLPL